MRNGGQTMKDSINQLRKRHKLVGPLTSFSLAVAIVAFPASLYAGVNFGMENLFFLCCLVAMIVSIISCVLFQALRERLTDRIALYDRAEAQLRALFAENASDGIASHRAVFEYLARREPSIAELSDRFSTRADLHYEGALNKEVRTERQGKVDALCRQASSELARRIEHLRNSSPEPALRTKRVIEEALASIREQKAAAQHQADEAIKRSFLKWRKKLTRPSFTEVDEAIFELEKALKAVESSPEYLRADHRFAQMESCVEQRVAKIRAEAQKAVPATHKQPFDDEWVVRNALYASALSVPISAWGDLSQAADIFGSLREVNGNYAEMSDLDIWFETLVMPGQQLAGLVSLTKGAYFEELVEADFGGERFDNFNNADTDIVLDGVEMQIKATDSVGYINSVAEHIPVISTSEVAEATGSIDGGYTNEVLTDSVELALGGSVLDIGDTAVDSLLAGLGFISIVATVKGVWRGAGIYRQSGSALHGLSEGVGVTVEESFWAILGMVELATKTVVGVARVGSMTADRAKHWFAKRGERSAVSLKAGLSK